MVDDNGLCLVVFFNEVGIRNSLLSGLKSQKVQTKHMWTRNPIFSSYLPMFSRGLLDIFPYFPIFSQCFPPCFTTNAPRSSRISPATPITCRLSPRATCGVWRAVTSTFWATCERCEWQGERPGTWEMVLGMVKKWGDDGNIIGYL